MVQRGQRGAEGGLGGWVAGGLVEVWWGEEKAGKEGRLGERLCDPGKRREKRSGLVSVRTPEDEPKRGTLCFFLNVGVGRSSTKFMDQ